MDVHSTPRVTIEGGPGWQVDGSSPDVIGTDPGSGPRRRPSRALVAAVVVSALLGFVAATVLAEWRHGRAGEVNASTLSVSVWSTGDGRDGYPVSIKDGRPRLRIPFELSNTGPREIELVSVRLKGTAVATEDLAGKRLAAGSQARAFLVRPLDCGSEPSQAASGGDVSRLTVRARTDAGEREVEVRAALNTGLLSREVALQMCGEVPPDEALMTDVTHSAVEGRAALLSLQVGNGSRHRISVERVRAVLPWLSARFVDEQGRAVPTPFSLAAGDFSTPRQPWDVRERQTWRVEITVPDCRRVPSSITSDGEEQLISVDLDSGERSATVRLGGDPNEVMRELARGACPS